MLHSRCGPRHVPSRHIEVADAPTRKDPTGTSRLRARMRAEGDRRWQTLARTLRQALTEHDLLGMQGVGRLPHGDKADGFAQWLREELRQKVYGFDGRWLVPYVREAAAIAQSRATELAAGAVDPARVASMATLAASELRGICEAAQQQLTRAVTHCLMANASPTRTANAAAGVIRTMRNRTRAMGEYVIAKTHATATLSAFRAAGVQRVGIIPERLRKPRLVQAAHGNDAAVFDRPPRTGPGSRVSREETPSASTIARIEKAQEKLEAELGTGEVDVINGPDPCPICEEIAAAGPYSLAEAEELIPQHPFACARFHLRVRTRLTPITRRSNTVRGRAM